MKVCPNCGATVFNIIHQKNISHTGIDVDENKEFIFVDLDDTEVQEGYQIQCQSCGSVYDLLNPEQADLFKYPKVTCTSCGKEYREDEVNEDGLCILCQVKATHPELENLSEGQMLIAMAKLMSEKETLSKPAPKKRGRKPKKKEEDEVTEGVAVENVDIDDQEENDDISISEVSPDIPDSVKDQIGDLEEGSDGDS